MDANDWRGLELRHLVTLQTIALHGTFGRAAEHLGYTQSAVSQQIATLEAVVGQRLIERSRGQPSVDLTEAGRLLLGHANAIIARMEAARADFAEFGRGALGVLRVGTYQSISTHVLPRLMRDFSAAWPQVEVRVTEAAAYGLLPQVERGEIDLCFDLLPLPEGPFESVQLLRDPYVVLVAAHSSLARRKQPPSRRELAAQPWISYRHPHDTALLEGFARGQGAEPRIIFRSDDNGAVQGMVGAGLGVALVPTLAVDTRDTSVVALPVSDAIPPRVLCLVWHRDRYRSPAARAFVDATVRLCRALSADRV